MFKQCSAYEEDLPPSEDAPKGVSESVSEILRVSMKC